MELVIVAVILIGLIFSITASRKSKKSIKEGRDARGASFSAKFKHATGLPIAQSDLVDLYVCENHLAIESSAAKSKLDYERIRDASIVSSTEIINQRVSSIGGAVAGAVIFGPLGAIIGGRSKNHKTKKIDKFLVVVYDKKDNLEQLAFSIEDATAELNAQKLIAAIKPRLSAQVREITL